jgi:hypothetical protein
MNDIVWQTDDEIPAWRYAAIGQHECSDKTIDYVFGVIHSGYETKYGWEVVISNAPDKPEGWMVGCGDTDDLAQAMKDAEYIGKEWIKGDSPIWDESGESQ